MARLGFAPLLLLLFGFAARTAVALYTKGDGVVELDDFNFKRLVMQSEGVAVVEFYAPW